MLVLMGNGLSRQLERVQDYVVARRSDAMRFVLSKRTLPVPSTACPTSCRAAAASLGADKASLEQQLQGVLAAERELTAHLRETHAAIEGQLTALRDQLQVGAGEGQRTQR